MSLLDPNPTNPPLVVLGKPNPRKDELEALTTFGRYMAHLDRIWQTTATPGVPQILREAYLKERERLGKPSHMSIIGKDAELPTHRFVLVFTNKKFEDLLDAKYPQWRTYGWHITRDSKAAKDLTKDFAYILGQLGIKLLPDDGGSLVDKVSSE